MISAKTRIALQNQLDAIVARRQKDRDVRAEIARQDAIARRMARVAWLMAALSAVGFAIAWSSR